MYIDALDCKMIIILSHIYGHCGIKNAILKGGN